MYAALSYYSIRPLNLGRHVERRADVGSLSNQREEIHREVFRVWRREPEVHAVFKLLVNAALTY